MKRASDQSNQSDRNKQPKTEQGPGWSAAEHERRAGLYTVGGGHPSSSQGDRQQGQEQSGPQRLSEQHLRQLEQQINQHGQEAFDIQTGQSVQHLGQSSEGAGEMFSSRPEQTDAQRSVEVEALRMRNAVSILEHNYRADPGLGPDNDNILHRYHDIIDTLETETGIDTSSNASSIRDHMEDIATHLDSLSTGSNRAYHFGEIGKHISSIARDAFESTSADVTRTAHRFLNAMGLTASGR